MLRLNLFNRDSDALKPVHILVLWILRAGIRVWVTKLIVMQMSFESVASKLAGLSGVDVSGDHPKGHSVIALLGVIAQQLLRIIHLEGPSLIWVLCAR